MHPSIADAVQSVKPNKNIALIAYEHHTMDLLDWAKYNSEHLSNHNLFGTGTPGKLVSEKVGLSIFRGKSIATYQYCVQHSTGLQSLFSQLPDHFAPNESEIRPLYLDYSNRFNKDFNAE